MTTLSVSFAPFPQPCHIVPPTPLALVENYALYFFTFFFFVFFVVPSVFTLLFSAGLVLIIRFVKPSLFDPSLYYELIEVSFFP